MYSVTETCVRSRSTSVARFSCNSCAPALDAARPSNSVPIAVFTGLEESVVCEDATLNIFTAGGRIYPLASWRALLEIPSCIGAKHSSLSRRLEWDRLRVRDEVRPDFSVLTGNDLAIDMIIFGSDYLLGLATFAPDAFARRDRLWAAGDPAWAEVNDALQGLGAFAFRAPVPAYKASAAQFLALRGWAGPAAAHPAAPGRPDGDVEVLSAFGRRLGVL